jgi:putative ABC transport system ATP-binding protein
MRITGAEVTVAIDGREVFRRASLTCEPGTMTALVGPSGCGKTTLLHCMGLLHVPTAGAVLVDDVDTTSWSARRRRRFWAERAAFVLQDYGVMEEESVAFNVTMTANALGSRVRGDRRRMAAALDQTGLAGRHGELAAHLSGGEKQRLSVARAIYKDARVVYVDEPTASLDEANRAIVTSLFRSLADRGCIVIVATHDAGMTEACDRQFSFASRPVDQYEHVGS